MPMGKDLEAANRIFYSTQTIRFDDQPCLDVCDRLGLFTVVVGRREVAAHSLITRQVRPALHRGLRNLTTELACL
jgi:hypothetical protein